MSLPTPYPPGQEHTVPASSGVAVPLSKSQRIRVINTHGTQVIDFWAFQRPPPSSTAASPTELTTFLSMAHTRAALLAVSPTAPCTLTNNVRDPILKFVSDTSGGVHDTLIPACDPHRYRQLGVPEGTYHASCADNLRAALARDTPAYAMPASMIAVPDPLNLFMNIPVVPPETPLASTNASAGGGLGFEPAISPKGGACVFEALVDCIVVMSACPQDLIKEVNGGIVRDCHFFVED